MKVRRALASDNVTGWALAGPAVLLIFVFGVIPIIWAFLLSFEKSNLINPSTPWVGLGNYHAMTQDPLLKQAAAHTLFYTAVFVPLSVFGGLLIAIALNRKIRGIKWYRTAVFVPVVASTIAAAIMFSWLFDKNFGLVNAALGKIGLGPFGFFESPNGAMFSIILMTLWGWIGFNVIIYLAALQGIPQELIEAAAIDGAGPLAVFRNITLPLLGPATLFLVVWSSINALQLFDEVYFLTRGGPANATLVAVVYLFHLAFEQGLAGYASAIAYVLFLVILVLTLIQLWVGRRVVHYS